MARLWDAKDGQPLATLPGHRSAVTSVAFSSDGRHLLTGSDDGTARLWPATPEGFLIQACQYLHPLPAYDQVVDTCAPYLDRTPSALTFAAQDVPRLALEGTPAVHTSSVQAFSSSGRSEASFCAMVAPLPSNTTCLQSPAVCMGKFDRREGDGSPRYAPRAPS